MTGDFSRSTFRSTNHYSQVRLQQGRGVLDADLNEQADIDDHVQRRTTTDVVGASGAPFHPPSTFQNFQIKVDTVGKDLLIAPGRFYVDGILCEHDEAAVTFLTQPDFPGIALPKEAGSYAVFLDVWERHITASEQRGDGFPSLREAALGGADTASRVRVVWQVKAVKVSGNTCAAFTPPAAPNGKLRASEIPAAPATSDCMVPASGGYRRLENQLYRVEVSAISGSKVPYKWSRDNASIASKVKSTDQNAATIVVDDAGRDDVIGFAAAKYVELTNESLALNGQPGALLEVEAVTGTSIRVKNPANVSLALGTNPILRRWDGIGDLAANTPVELEDGVRIEIDGGTFSVGDYWLVPARTLTGRVEWPRSGGGDSIFETRHGTIHHYAPLAIVSFNGTVFASGVQDCRKLFPPLTAITARDVSYDPAQCSNLKGATTVQQAIDILCQSPGRETEEGIHIKGVFLPSGAALLNDNFVAPAELVKGIRIDCDEPLFEGSVVNTNGQPNPVCTVTVELPWPLRGDERQFWGLDAGTIVGFQPVTLAADVVVARNSIAWTPLPPTQKWLSDRLLQMYQEMTNQPNPRVLVRLKLRGNFIWGPEFRPKFYLDGETFGMPADGRVDARLPSGNGRAGGDFDMWFWLLRQGVRIPGIGFFPGRASRFFAVSGTTSPGKEAVQLGIERSSPDLRGVLPAGYEVDAGQRFNAVEAAGLARRTGASGMAGLASDKYGRLAPFLSDRLQGVLRIAIRLEVVPDAQLMERVRAGMATGAPPDFVIGDEGHGPLLQRLDYTTDFIRL